MPKAVVITGASRGLGLALTRKFLNAGWQVYGVSRTKKYWKTALSKLPTKTKLSRFRERAGIMKSLPSKAAVSFHALDLTSETQVKKFAVRFKKKSPELLINNAGYGGDLLRVEETSVTEYQKLMNGNLLSAFLMCKHFVPLMRKQKRGTIFNISSMAGQRAVPQLAAYSMAKFGVIALSQAVAKENLDIPIKCLTICPGGMNTEMRAKIFGKEDASRQQSTDFVSETILDIYENKILVDSGGDIVIRHGKITAVHPCPGV